MSGPIIRRKAKAPLPAPPAMPPIGGPAGKKKRPPSKIRRDIRYAARLLAAIDEGNVAALRAELAAKIEHLRAELEERLVRRA